MVLEAVHKKKKTLRHIESISDPPQKSRVFKIKNILWHHHNLAASSWVFPKIGVPENGWFIVENPIKMDD